MCIRDSPWTIAGRRFVSNQNSNTKAKVAFLSILLVAAVAMGLYLSGYIVLMMLKLHGHKPHWDTWLTYYKAMHTPQVLPLSLIHI